MPTRQAITTLLGSIDLTSPTLPIQPPAPRYASPSLLEPHYTPRGRSRDIGAELASRFGSPGVLRAANKLRTDEHFMSPRASPNLSMKNIWLAYFTDTLGSEEKALATLRPSAPLPEFAVFGAFVYELGRWGMEEPDWSYLSTKKNLDYILSMVCTFPLSPHAYIHASLQLEEHRVQRPNNVFCHCLNEVRSWDFPVFALLKSFF